MLFGGRILDEIRDATFQRLISEIITEDRIKTKNTLRIVINISYF